MKKTFLFLTALVAFQLYSCNHKNHEDEKLAEAIEVVEEPEIEVLEPVKWTYNTEKVGEHEYKITFNATIDEGWHVYSTTIEGDGPIPTSINFDENAALAETKTIEESGAETKEGYDEMFDMEIKKFGKSATFSQVVKVNAPTTLTGYLEYMTCDNEKCLFPDPVEFTFDVE